MIVIIFRIIRAASTIIIIIIMDRYSKSIRSSYKPCFLHCLFCEKKCFLILLLYVLTLSAVFKKSGNLFQILGRYERLLSVIGFSQWLVAYFKKRSPSSSSGLICQFKYIIQVQRTLSN